jgi:hypothetical protein
MHARICRSLCPLLVGLSMLAADSATPPKTKVPSGPYGVIIRSILRYPTTPNSPEFVSKAAVPEGPLSKPEDFLAVLKEQNPEWDFEMMGEMFAPYGGETTLKTDHFEGFIRFLKPEALEKGHLTNGLQTDGEAQAWISFQSMAKVSANDGAGFSSDHYEVGWKPDEAYLIADQGDEGSLKRYITFATVASKATIDRRLKILADAEAKKKAEAQKEADAKKTGETQKDSDDKKETDTPKDADEKDSPSSSSDSSKK